MISGTHIYTIDWSNLLHNNGVASNRWHIIPTEPPYNTVYNNVLVAHFTNRFNTAVDVPVKFQND